VVDRNLQLIQRNLVGIVGSELTVLSAEPQSWDKRDVGRAERERTEHLEHNVQKVHHLSVCKEVVTKEKGDVSGKTVWTRRCRRRTTTKVDEEGASSTPQNGAHSTKEGKIKRW
jgi:hypothetical protein